MANRNEKKKLTREDKWWRLYPDNAGHRVHRDDKKRNTKWMRKYSKKICKKGLTNNDLDDIL